MGEGAVDYRDAVKLLRPLDERLVDALDKAAGGLLLAVVPVVPALLSWFDAKAEFVRVSAALVARVGGHRDGGRYTRTQRLHAAHAVLVVSAFFDVVDELPVPLREWKLTGQEQLMIAGGPPPTARGLMDAVFAVGDVLPDATSLTRHDDVYEYYGRVAAALGDFLFGLAAWESLSAAARTDYTTRLSVIAARAHEHYQELCRRLAVEVPEVGRWLDVLEHNTTRAGIREAFDSLEQTLRDMSVGGTPIDQVSALATAARAALDRPVVESGDVPDGVRVPALRHIYLTPRYRVLVARPGLDVSDEMRWADHPEIEDDDGGTAARGPSIRDDLDATIAHHLVSASSATVPLLVLGQPGSGKSVLTTILAARLPAGDYFPVRVALRDVPAGDDVQEQVEAGIFQLTGERTSWPALVRAACGATPVVLLDGFDELVQATAVTQSDYLKRVAAFQQRELDLGRPTVVVVTSRMTAMHRVFVPDGTVTIRLEPFDYERVTEWLVIWNETNRDYFATAGIGPLTEDVALRHPELAGQPLLLLMLALYDTDGNALQRLGSDLRQADLYEGLIGAFVRREVTRQRPALAGSDLDRAVEAEIRQLSVVAFAMFNRHGQSVTAAALNDDLRAVYGESAHVPADLRARLRPAEALLSRFFFVHRSRAVRDDEELATYEFLHATFGEYLVARQALLALRDTASNRASAALAFARTRADDDLLHALLSFTVLTARVAVLTFLTELFDGLAVAERTATVDTACGLLRDAHLPRRSQAFGEYQPALPHVGAQYAAYTANLMLLATVGAGSLPVTQLLDAPGHEAIGRWTRLVSLWRSQVSTEALDGLVTTLKARRIWTTDDRDLLLSVGNPEPVAPLIDLGWTYGKSDAMPRDALFRWGQDTWERWGNIMADVSDDVTRHIITTLKGTVGWDAETVRVEGDAVRSPAVTMLGALITPLTAASETERLASYRAALASVSPARPNTYAVLISLIFADEGVATASLATLPWHTYAIPPLQPAILRGCLTRLLRDGGDHFALLDDTLQLIVLLHPYSQYVELVLEACISLQEYDLDLPPGIDTANLAGLVDLTRRRDLAARLSTRLSPCTKPSPG